MLAECRPVPVSGGTARSGQGEARPRQHSEAELGEEQRSEDEDVHGHHRVLARAAEGMQHYWRPGCHPSHPLEEGEEGRVAHNCSQYRLCGARRIVERREMLEGTTDGQAEEDTSSMLRMGVPVLPQRAPPPPAYELHFELGAAAHRYITVPDFCRLLVVTDSSMLNAAPRAARRAGWAVARLALDGTPIWTLCVGGYL